MHQKEETTPSSEWPWSTSTPPLPPFTFHFSNMLCAQLDFGHLEGLSVNYPSVIEGVRMQGLKLANEKNCRLCNLVGNPHGAALHVELTCAAKKDLLNDNTAETCMKGNGKVAWTDFGTDPCLPCPEECSDCSTVSFLDALHNSERWFECHLPSRDLNTQTVPSLPWECEAATEALLGGGMTWCRYRNDLLQTGLDAHTIPDKLDQSWQVEFGAVPCDMSSQDGDDLHKLVDTVRTKMQDAYDKENCQLCRVEAGGNSIDLNMPFQYFVPSKDFWGNPVKGPDQWAHAHCGFQELGEIACRTSSGPVGFSHGCLACPVECSKCIPTSTEAFRCDLKAVSHSSEQLHALLTDSVAHISPRQTPIGFNCNPPAARDCQRDDVLCSGMFTDCFHKGQGTDAPPTRSGG